MLVRTAFTRIDDHSSVSLSPIQALRLYFRANRTDWVYGRPGYLDAILPCLDGGIFLSRSTNRSIYHREKQPIISILPHSFHSKAASPSLGSVKALVYS